MTAFSGTLKTLAGWGRPLRELLFLSLADDRLVPHRHLSILPEDGGVLLECFFCFLGRERRRGVRRYLLEEDGIPAPEALAAAVFQGVNDLQAAGVPATLVLPAPWAIVRTAAFPLTIRENLSGVISAELDRLTPLTPERAFYDFRVLAQEGERISIQLAAARDETVQPYLDALGQKGIAVRRVAVAGVAGMNLLAKGGSRSRRPPFALTILLLATLATLGIYWLVSPLQIEERRIAAIDREIASRREEVRQAEVRQKEIDVVAQEIAVIGKFKQSRPVVLDLLRELTLILPPKAWLSRVRLSEANAEIEGYAPSSTEILPKLEASKHFRKVEFSSPTFRDTRLNADRFIVKMEIEVPGGVSDHEKTK